MSPLSPTPFHSVEFVRRHAYTILATLSPLTIAFAIGASCSPRDTASSSANALDDSISNAEGREILANVVSAAGGQENLDAIRTLAVQYVHTLYTTGSDDDSGADPPRSVDVVQVRDFENGRHLYEVHVGGDTPAWERVVILPDGAFSVDLNTRRTTLLASNALTGAQYGGIQLRWYVYAALGEVAMAGPNLRHANDTTLNGRMHHIVTYPGINTETINMWIDGETNLIVRREIIATDPILGRATARLEFTDYQNVGGIPMPMDISVYNGDRLHERFEMQEIRINAEVQESAFEPPVP